MGNEESRNDFRMVDVSHKEQVTGNIMENH